MNAVSAGRSPIPVILLAGFLGAGKTTLLNHLLREVGSVGAIDARIGVLVNDFGAVNVDALLVAGQADGAVSLANGCMCCSVDRDGLDAALAKLLAPAARIDAIVIEASGIAEPRSLIRMITGSSDPRMRYGGLVYVVDAAMFARMRREHPAIDGHVEIADLLVLNKIDLINSAELDAIGSVLGALNPTAAHVAVVDARIDPEVLFDPAPAPADDDDRPRQLTLDALLAETTSARPEPPDPASEVHVGDHPAEGRSHGACHGTAGHRHLHDDFVSVEFVSASPMDPRRLAAFLERPPTGCYRIKGVVHFDVPGHRQRHIVHGVGGFVEVRSEPWAGRLRETNIVAIGAGMDSDKALAALRAAVADASSVDDEHGILHITRHLPNR